jgi:glycosyltransferase involved in cell wall biosynthesis
MKIIALMNSFWVGEGGGMSGGDRRMLEVAKWWRSCGIRFEVFSSEDGGRVCQDEGLGEFCRTTAPGWADSFGLLPSYFLRIFYTVLKVPKFGSDFVAYSSSDFLTDVLPALFVKLLNRRSRWIALSHHIIRGRFISSSFQRMSFVLIKRFSDLVIVPSRTTKRELLFFGFRDQQIKVILPNGLNMDFISKIPEDAARRSEVCFLARLNPSKGIYDLPEIWKEVTGSLGDAHLIIMGGGGSVERKKLGAALRGAGRLNNVRVLGFVSEKEKYALLKSSKVFISPSHEEGFGIAVLEAMACGLPVVAWDLPVYREVFKKGMVRVPLGDHKAFAAAVIELLRSDKLRRRLGEEAKSFASRYNWAQVAESEWRLMEDLLR